MSALKVAVLAGGRSSEHEVSIASATSVAEGLTLGGHEVLWVEVGREDGIWRHQDEELSLTPGRGLAGADVAFPVLHGPGGEDGTIQGLLECLDVPYVGAGVFASALCIDKLRFKDAMAQAGLPQIPYHAVLEDDWREDAGRVSKHAGRLGLPVFVKPARLGSSVGISRAATVDELGAAIELALNHDPRVIVEAAAGGVEVECSVIGNRELEVSEPGEIMLASGEAGWYDYEAKYKAGGMELIIPPRISRSAVARVRDLAAETFRASGCRGLARVDFFVEDEEVLVNELNTMPGFTATSVFAALFASSGLAYPDLLSALLRLAREEHAEKRAHIF